MRLFIALIPPPEIREHLSDFLDPRREAGPDLRVARPDSLRDALASAIPETAPEAELARRLDVPLPVAAAYAAHLRRRPVPAGSEPLSAAAAGLLAGRMLRSLTDDGPVLWVDRKSVV